MKWWLTAWQLARDILLTGTGLFLIISQVGARDPSSALIVAGLALTVPAAATHAASVLSGPSSPHRAWSAGILGVCAAACFLAAYAAGGWAW